MQAINDIQHFASTCPTLFVSLIVWSLVWKGFALWKAGKNNSPIWFVILLVINTLGLLEIIYLFAIKNEKSKTETIMPSPAPEIKTETEIEKKVEILAGEKKEEIYAPVPEVKIEEPQL